MYLLDFVNNVRDAQSCEELATLPPPGADGSSPLELAMGCRLEGGQMRLSSRRPQRRSPTPPGCRWARTA